MPSIEISGIFVKLPFEPDTVHEDYVASVIKNLNKMENVVLKSPTG